MEVAGFKIGLRKQSTMLMLANVLEALEGAILVLDEFQELRYSPLRLNKLLAYAYDHLNLKVVASGSQVGLLHRFLRLNDPEAPLFGRPYSEVTVRRFSRGEALNFLEAGFSEAQVTPLRDLIERALDFFDGIAGWLTYFGYSYLAGAGILKGL